MRNLRRPDDMPLYGRITRIHKGRYEVIIKFVASKRILHHEQLHLPNKKAVQQFYLREFPTLTWGEPKYPRTKVKARVSAKPRVRTKKLTRKSKPRKRKAKNSDTQPEFLSKVRRPLLPQATQAGQDMASHRPALA
jgi:hypothetical protein